MKDNYLWDRTGEPDPEVQELEELLGTLRYQPRPLEIPADIRIARKRNYFPLAIAAAIALFVIGAGLLIQISRTQAPPATQAQDQPQVEPGPEPAPTMEQPKQLVTDGAADKIAPPQRQQKRILTAANRPRVAPRQPALTPAELAEKEQVLDALRLVSAKLNLAQRKVQGLPQKNIFRNQNRIG